MNKARLTLFVTLVTLSMILSAVDPALAGHCTGCLEP